MSNSATSGALPQQAQRAKKRASARPAPATEIVEVEDAELPPPPMVKQQAVDSPLKKPRAKGVSPSSPPGGTDKNGRRAALIMGPAFSRSAFLLVLAVLLLTGLWNWASSSLPDVSTTTVIQLKELEDFSRKTTKWMQVQLEIVDMKIGKQVLGLRQEMESKLEDRAVSLEASISSLRSQVEGMDASVDKLMLQGLLTKSEAVELMRSMVESGSSKALSLDDVRAAARHIVEAELDRHSADGIGRVDYALGSGGGRVVDHSEAVFQGAGAGTSGASWFHVLGAGLSAGGTVRHPMADKVIQPSFGEPGQCLPLKGSSVFVDVALRTRIFPRAITVEHVSKSVAYDVTSAPKEFAVLGWMQSSGSKSRGGSNKVLLGEFGFDADGPSVQTFDVQQQQQQQLVNTVRLQVRSNHGNPWHTCIYRLRVHGSEH